MRAASAVTGQLDTLMPEFDTRHRHSLIVRAPAALVYQIARQFDVQSVGLVRFIFWLRTKFMRATPTARKPQAFIDEILSLGWGCLREEPGELFIAGAVCQPWLANVIFTAVPSDGFLTFAERNQVKIAWTLETHSRGVEVTELATETRAVATDRHAQTRFVRYWRWARVGILPIRWLLLPAIRRRAETQWRHRVDRSGGEY